MSSKTLYEEAIADVKKLKQLAENQARDLVLQKVEPRIKQLVEQQLFQESSDDEESDVEECNECDSDMEEASTTASVAGYTAPLGAEPKKDKLDETEDEQYEVTEGDDSSLAHLAEFTRPISDDKFIAEVFRIHDKVGNLVTTKRSIKLTNEYMSQLVETISKLEDMYVYLKESYSGKDMEELERKLEKSYGLANAVKESTMKMRDLLNEETLTMKINGLSDDVDLDGLTVDIVADETDETTPDDGVADVGDETVAAGAPEAAPPQTEGDEMDDEEVLEISESELKSELSRLTMSEGDGLEDFGDAESQGHPEVDKVSDLDQLTEMDAMSSDEDEDKQDAGSTAPHVGSPQAKMESAHVRLSRAAKRLTESKGTKKEEFARAMYRSALRAYKSAKLSLVESRKTQTKTQAPVVKNTADSKKLVEAVQKVNKLTKQLTEANLLNAKLIHANKLLRLEGLTKAQKAMVIDRLDEAQNLREVRLISESLIKVLTGSKDSVNESAVRRPQGSASRTSQSGAMSKTLVKEGMETARWAELAGIK